MEEKIRIVSSVKEDLWSRFVLENPYGNIFQTPEMKEVYSKTKRMEPISLFAVDESDNILSSVLAYVSTEKGGVFKHVSRRAVISGGPLFTQTETGRKSVVALMEEYDKLASKRAIFTEIRMLYDIPDFRMFRGEGYIHEEHLNFLLSLNRPLDELFEGIHNAKRRAIKKAEKAGVVVKEVNEKEDITAAYSLLRETYKRAQIPLADVSLFESVFDVLGPLGHFKAFILKHDGEPIATRILLTYRDVIYDWYNGSNELGLRFSANDLSEWHAIKWSKEKGYILFDFCGAGKPNEPYGPREFKKRFSGQLVNFGRYQKVYHPTRLKIAKAGYKVYRRAFIK